MARPIWILSVLASLGFAQAPALAAPQVLKIEVPNAKVAAILDAYCVRCHDTLASVDARLDLTRWIRLEDGRYSFPHEDLKTKKQYSKSHTLTRFRAAITESNEDNRMPLGDPLSEENLKLLLDWVDEESAR